MKIQNSNVTLYSHSYDYESKKTTLVQGESKGLIQNSQGDTFKDQLKKLNHDLNLELVSLHEYEYQMTEEDKEIKSVLELLLSKLLGRDIRFLTPGKIQLNKSNFNEKVKQVFSPSVRITQESVQVEKSSGISFHSHGGVTTEDGRQIKFDMNLIHTRQIHYSEVVKRETKAMTDPLTLSFNGQLPSLTQEKYAFDLDQDGTKDQISFLTKESGFLSLDLNGDGKINDGGELFGTKSGSGFKDLAVFDGDGNGWIDENDEVFDKLRIWMKDESGEDKLIALGEKGIGALFLGSVESDFDLLSDEFEVNGRIRQSGIYLKEDGSTGGLHHMDIQL